MVQWPLLCTRGAISLTISRAPRGRIGAEMEHLHRQHADIVERLGDAARRWRAPRPGRPRAGRRARPTGAGCRPRGCSPGSRSRRSRRRARARSARTARSGTPRAAPARWGRRRRPPRRRRQSLAGRRCSPAPCRRSRGGATSGSPPALRAGRGPRARASGPSTASNGATGIASPAMNSFSTRRSCATSSALGDGRTGTLRARMRAVSTRTFSNS